MKTAGNTGGGLLPEKWRASRAKHLASDGAGRFRTRAAPDQMRWADNINPGNAGWEGIDGFIDVIGALELALLAERRGRLLRRHRRREQQHQVKRILPSLPKKPSTWRTGETD